MYYYMTFQNLKLSVAPKWHNTHTKLWKLVRWFKNW